MRHKKPKPTGKINPVCEECQQGCKQTDIVVVVHCPKFSPKKAKNSKNLRVGDNPNIPPVRFGGGMVPSSKQRRRLMQITNLREVSAKLSLFDIITDDGTLIRGCRFFPERNSVAGPSHRYTASDGAERWFEDVRLSATLQATCLDALSKS